MAETTRPARAAKLRANETMHNNQLPSYYLKMDLWRERKKKKTPLDPRITIMNLLLSQRKDKIQKIKEACGTSMADTILEEAYLWAPSHRPKQHRRVIICEDLSKGREPHPVPMYCDLKCRDKKTVPDPRRFKYIVKNEIFDLDAEEQIIVKKCDCTGDCDENCECFQFGINMNNGQVQFIDGALRITNPETDVCTHVLIVCGPLCKCAPTCPRRIENMMKKFKFEVFRRDPEAGFGVKTLSDIIFGELVMEFVGEVIPEEEITQRELAEDYALELSNGEEKTLIRRAKALIPSPFPGPWKSLLDPCEMIHIDGSLRGNLSRFILNGCWPSLQLIRVIENYVHPRCHRLFLYATHDIPAGMELTFFYGEDYLNSQQRQFECKCKTLLCERGGGMRLLKEIQPKQVKKAISNVLQIWRKMAEKGRELEEAEQKALANANNDDDVEQEALDYSADVSDEEGSSSRDESNCRNIKRRQEEIEVIVLSSDDDESQEVSDSERNARGYVVGTKTENDVSDDNRYQEDAALHLQDELESDSDEEEAERMEDDGEEPVLRVKKEEGNDLRLSYGSESESDSDSTSDSSSDSDDDGGAVGDVNEECKGPSDMAERPLQQDQTEKEAVLQEEVELALELAQCLTEEERRAREIELEYLEGVHPAFIGDAYKQSESYFDHWHGRPVTVSSLFRAKEQELAEYEKRRAADAAEAERQKAQAAAREAERVKRDTVAAPEDEPHTLRSRGRFRDLTQNMFHSCRGNHLQGHRSTGYERQSNVADYSTGRKRMREDPGDHQHRQGGHLHAEERGRQGSVNSGGFFHKDHHRNNYAYEQRQKRPFHDFRHSSRDIPVVTLSSDEEERSSLQRSNQHLQEQSDPQTHRSSHRDSSRFQDFNRDGSAPRGHHERAVSRKRFEDHALPRFSPCPSPEYRPTSPQYSPLDGDEMETDENQLFLSHGDQRRRQYVDGGYKDRRLENRLRDRSVIVTQGVHHHRRYGRGGYEDLRRDERDHRRYNESYKRRTMDYEFRGDSLNYDRYSPRRERDGSLHDNRRPYEPQSPEILRKPSPEPWESFNPRSSDRRQYASFNTGYPRNEGYDEHQRRNERRRRHEDHHRRRRHHGSYNKGREMDCY